MQPSTIIYMIKLIDNEKIKITKEDFDKLTEGLFIDSFKFTSRSKVCQMVIPLKNIKLWYAVDPNKFKNQDLKE